MDSYRAGATLVVIGVGKRSLYDVVVDDGVLGLFAKATMSRRQTLCSEAVRSSFNVSAGTGFVHRSLQYW
jgi:hypothetical protein